jgi:hypothetical protein
VTARQSKADARREAQRSHVERILRMYRAKLDQAHAAGDVVQVVALTLRCADHIRPTIPMGGGLITGTEADELAALVVAELTERGRLLPAARAPSAAGALTPPVAGQLTLDLAGATA